MPRYLTSDTAADTIEALSEAFDLLDLGVAVLDRDMRVQMVNRHFAELWPMPPCIVPTVEELVGAAAGSLHPGGTSNNTEADTANALDGLAAAIGAGEIPSTQIRLSDGTRLLLRCRVRRNGGRVLTCADLLSPETIADQTHQARDFAERAAVDLRFSNETLESQASYLASLAEAADANAQAAEEANRQLEREVAERRLLESKLRHMATTDALTGTLNRAQFLTLGQRELDRVRERGLDLAVLMLDIDHFKAINDHYGHAVGDDALRHLVAGLRVGTRRIDLLGRLGGEEFALVLPAIAAEAAAVVAERLRSHIAGHPVPHATHKINMTISIGVAMLGGSERTVEQLLARADGLLYAAKHAGRNRVVFEPQPIAA